MNWDVVIGIETHVQLQTKTKIFSGASTAFGAEANTQACVLSIALPGTLPVLNYEAVQCAIKFGLATNAEIAPRSISLVKIIFILTYLKAIKLVNMNYQWSVKDCSRSK